MRHSAICEGIIYGVTTLRLNQILPGNCIEILKFCLRITCLVYREYHLFAREEVEREF